MNHGGLGYLNVQGGNTYLQFPPELLEHSFFRRDGVMYGIYYPPRDRDDYQNIRTRHDLMLTPIPYRFWPRAARLILRIPHEPEMIHEVSTFLANEHISILQSESTRSGYRYETWSFYIIFEDLENKKLRYDKKNSVYRETRDRLKKLKRDLVSKCRSALFVDVNDMDLRIPVVTLHNTALAYFYNQSSMRRTTATGQEWMYEPFVLRCTGGGTLVSEDGYLSSILSNLERTHSEKLSPTVVFAGLDTQYLNLRAGIIPCEQLSRFVEIRIDYTRNGPPDTCVGIISSLTETFPREFNIWSSYIRTFQSTDIREEGRIVFIVEDQGNATDSKEVFGRAQSALAKLNTRLPALGCETLEFKEPKIWPMTAAGVQSRTQQVKDRGSYDVFISYCEEDRPLVDRLEQALMSQNLSTYLAPRRLPQGNEFAEEIRQAIERSREVFVVCSRTSLESEWVLTEWGAAWGFGKTIIPVLCGMEKEDLPDRLRSRQAVPIHYNLHEIAADAKARIDNLVGG